MCELDSTFWMLLLFGLFFVGTGRCICMHFVTIHRNNTHIWVCFYWCVKMRVWEDWWSNTFAYTHTHTLKIWGSRENETEQNHICVRLSNASHTSAKAIATHFCDTCIFILFTSLSPARAVHIRNALDFFFVFFFVLCYYCYLSMICNSCFPSSFSFACTFCFACVCGWSRSRSSVSAIHLKYELKKKNRHTHSLVVTQFYMTEAENEYVIKGNR